MLPLTDIGTTCTVPFGNVTLASTSEIEISSDTLAEIFTEPLIVTFVAFAGERIVTFGAITSVVFTTVVDSFTLTVIVCPEKFANVTLTVLLINVPFTIAELTFTVIFTLNEALGERFPTLNVAFALTGKGEELTKATPLGYSSSTVTLNASSSPVLFTSTP